MDECSKSGQCRFGRPYLSRSSMEKRRSDVLKQRAEDMSKRSVPDDVNFLVAAAGVNRQLVIQFII